MTAINDAAVLDYIRKFRAAQGFAPSRREIADALRVAHSAVHNHLKAMEAKGLVRQEPHQARTIAVVDK